MEARGGRPRGLPLAEIAVTLAGLALLVVLFLAVPALRESLSALLHGDTSEVRHQVDRLGLWGPLLIVLLTLVHAVVMYPAEIVDAAAGFAYGFLPALLLVTAGWMLSGLASWAVGGRVARPLLDRWLGAERFERMEAMIERGGATLLLSVRLIPIFPFSLTSYAAGAARVPLWRFAWTTLVGYMPVTALAVYFGTRLEGLTLGDPLVIIAPLVLVALLVGGRWIMGRTESGRSNQRLRTTRKR